MRVYKHMGVIYNTYFNLSMDENCICTNVQGLCEFAHRLQWAHRNFWLTLYIRDGQIYTDTLILYLL
jgi:hypothetical protein